MEPVADQIREPPAAPYLVFLLLMASLQADIIYGAGARITCGLEIVLLNMDAPWGYSLGGKWASRGFWGAPAIERRICLGHRERRFWEDRS